MSTPIELLLPTDRDEIRLRGQVTRLPGPAVRFQTPIEPASIPRGVGRATSLLRRWMPRALTLVTFSADRLIFGSQGAPTRAHPDPFRPALKPLAPAARPSEAVRPHGSPLARRSEVPDHSKHEAAEALRGAIRALDRWSSCDPTPSSTFVRS